MSIENYRDLDVWKLGIRLSLDVYKLTSEFPKQEQYGLVSQLRRCAVSVPSNVAEGHARFSTRDFLRHISIALGSLAELETQLIISQELSYSSEPATHQLLETADRLGKQLRTLSKSLQARIERESN